jgi:hypothetical protein
MAKVARIPLPNNTADYFEIQSPVAKFLSVCNDYIFDLNLELMHANLL